MSLSSKIGSYWKETPFKFSVYTAVAITLVLGALVLTLKNNLPPILPLFYGKPVGEAELTPFYGFLIAPAASLLVIIINTLLSFTFKDVFIKKVLVLSALFITILIAVTVIKIIFLVGFF